jgi:type VI secretion system (T6SS) effector TldE1-like protein
MFGSAAVAGLMLGCAWTLYANVFGADVYPTLNSASFEAPVIKRPAMIAARSPAIIINSAFAALPEPASVASAPAAIASGPSLSFADRFAASAPQGEAPKLAEAVKPADAPKLAEAIKLPGAPKPQVVASLPPDRQAVVSAPSPRAVDARPARNAGTVVKDMAQRAKAAVMSIAANEKPSIVEKLWGKPESRGSLLSFASADASFTGSLPSETAKPQNPMLGGSPPYDRQTAVYDITAHVVYLPDGSKLEAHSGLGSRLDDPSSSNIRMHGVTPPHIYELTPREALFHGVPALRLNPIGGEEAIFGRSGLLAHTYMLGPNGDSNGCVSFRDYNAFLNAYRNQGIKRLAVVAHVD